MMKKLQLQRLWHKVAGLATVEIGISKLLLEDITVISLRDQADEH